MTRPDTVADVLDAAAGYIERDGWTQERYGNPRDGYCVYGAINKAVGGNSCFVISPQEAETDAAETSRRVELRNRARRAVSAQVGRDHLPTWNDEEGRTAGEVLDAFRWAAKHVREVES